MKKLKNKKGFTLVELLVAISILGIIMIIAIPQLGNIQSSNKKTKYVKYAESMLTSAKLYTDSYTEDMFGNNKSGCIDIPYTELKEKDLLKDIKVDQTTCKSDNSFVQVLKTNDHYIYGVSVSCKDQNNEVVYEKTIPKCGDNGPDETGPTISITSNLDVETWDYGIDKTATITMTDKYGMLENTKFKYYWTKDGEMVGEVETHNYKNKRYEGSSTEGEKLSHTIDIPQNKTGKYVLHVEPVDVRDANGNYQTHAVTRGEFYLDNTPPTTPEVSTYKWVNNEETSAPTSTTGLSGYTADTWSNKNVYSVAANSTDGDSDDNAGGVYYQYTTTGKTTEETDTNGSTRNIKAEGESTIQYRACDAIDNCSDYTDPIKVKVDKTKPTCGVIAVSGTTGDNGWYKSDVTITKTNGSDTISKHKETTITHESINSETTGTTVTLTTKDNADNICTTSTVVKIDKTTPTCGTMTVSGTKGSNGWYKSDVTITKTDGTDTGGSNHKSTTISSESLTSNTTGTKVTLTTKDNAGNVCTSSETIKIDKTAPTCGTMTITGTAGTNGWYKSNVTISKSDGSDTGGSGHNSTTLSHTSLTSETTGTTVTLTTTDKAGNSCTKTETIKIDKTAPKISFNSADTTNDGYCTLKSSYDITDEVSGVAKYCRSHCVSDPLSATHSNYCISGMSPKERVEYYFKNNTSLKVGSVTDNKTMCQTSPKPFQYCTTFGTTVSYALIAVDNAGNVSSTYTDSRDS